MPARLADSLIALAASIDGDGGHAVCRTLASLLRDTAPFDAGEVVLRHTSAFHRFPFGEDERKVAGDDLVKRVLASGAPLRIDDPRDLEPFAETRAVMSQAGLKSALVLPLGIILQVQAPPQAASANGVLVLARRHGWAFVGASLHFLGPLAAMAGLALDRALALTALGHPTALAAGVEPQPGEALRAEGTSLIFELQNLRSKSAATDQEVETLRASLASTRDDLADARGATIAAQSALDQAVGRCHELQAELDRATPVDPGRSSETAEADTSAVEPALGERLEVASPSLPAPTASRRGRRRRRGAFEPPGGPGA